MIYQERVFDACFCSLLHYFPRIHRPDEKRKKKTCTKVSIISFVFRRTTYGKRIYFQCVTHFVYFLVWKLKLISFRFRFSGTETAYPKNDLSQYT